MLRCISYREINISHLAMITDYIYRSSNETHLLWQQSELKHIQGLDGGWNHPSSEYVIKGSLDTARARMEIVALNSILTNPRTKCF